MEDMKQNLDESIVEETSTPKTEEAKVEAAKEESEHSEKSEEKKGKKSKKKSTKALELELEKSEAKVADLTDRYQRLMAEFENARKRNAKEQGRMYDVGAKEVLEKLLPVVDNFERGLDGLSEEQKQEPFAQGIAKIYQQMMDVLSGLGVSAMNAAGKEFNPDFHNAVMHVEDDSLDENVVVEEFQKGYMYKEMVLRHSMVKVAN